MTFAVNIHTKQEDDSRQSFSTASLAVHVTGKITHENSRLLWDSEIVGSRSTNEFWEVSSCRTIVRFSKPHRRKGLVTRKETFKNRKDIQSYKLLGEVVEQGEIVSQ